MFYSMEKSNCAKHSQKQTMTREQRRDNRNAVPLNSEPKESKSKQTFPSSSNPKVPETEIQIWTSGGGGHGR